MRQSRWARANVRCPLWRGDEDRKIGCEGPFDGAKLFLLQSEKGTRRHMEVFCCNKYENCEIYRMVVESRYTEE